MTDASFNATQSVVPKAAEAAAKYINEQLGGIQGRPVEILNCDPKADPAATQACANKIVQAGAIANVGNSLAMGACCMDIFEKGKVPLNTIPVLEPDMKTDWQYALSGFNVTVPWAVGQWLTTDMGAKNIVLITLDLPTTATSSAISKKSIGDAAQFNIVNYKFGLADLTAPVNSALRQKPDWIILSTSSPDEVKLISALTKAGHPVDRIITGGEGLDYDAFHKTLGDTAKGIYQTTAFKSFDDTSDEDVATYREAMDAAGAPARSMYAQWVFSSVMEVHRAASELDEISGEALHEHWRNAGPTPIFMGTESVALKDTAEGFPGVRYLDENIVQWDGDSFKVVATKRGFPEAPTAEQ